MTKEKYSKEEREFWSRCVHEFTYCDHAEGSITITPYDAVRAADYVLRSRRERFGARPDEPGSLEKISDEWGETLDRLAESEKRDREKHKPKTVKRSELKAGEWYTIKGMHGVWMATDDRAANDSCCDLRFLDSGAYLHYTTTSQEVTPCDPPEWFSKIWERKKPKQDDYAIRRLIDCARNARRLLYRDAVCERDSQEGPGYAAESYESERDRTIDAIEIAVAEASDWVEAKR